MAKIKIYEGDCRVVLKRLAQEGFRAHACITDGPYHLLSIVKRFGKEGSAPAKHGSDGRFTRASAGFMGKTWDGEEEDGYQIMHDPKVWKLVSDCLLPGGFVFSFSSAKTGHRMAVAMEDAGLTIHPMIPWLYAQGFPKAHAVGEDWPGWFHGGQTLNPSVDPIYVAQKPRSEKTNALNMAKHQTGAFNIDGARQRPRRDLMGDDPGKGTDRPRIRGKERNSARWPSNVAHDGSEAILGAFPAIGGGMSAADYFPSFPPFLYHGKATKADKFSGNVKVTIEWTDLQGDHQTTILTYPGGTSPEKDTGVSSTTGDLSWHTALCGSFITDLCQQGCKFTIETGTNSTTTSPIWKWLTRSLTNESTGAEKSLMGNGGSLAPNASKKNRWSITTRTCSGFQVGADLVSKNSQLTISVKEERYNHATIKPIGLLRWLIKLAVVPGGTILDPFAGTGTLGQAARLSGCNAVLIERDPAYLESIEDRLDQDREPAPKKRDLLE